MLHTIGYKGQRRGIKWILELDYLAKFSIEREALLHTPSPSQMEAEVQLRSRKQELP
jgi:hypothetical protein